MAEPPATIRAAAVTAERDVLLATKLHVPQTRRGFVVRAVLDRAIARLTAAVGTGDYTWASIDALLGAAADDPDGFRLLFHHAAREPQFRQQMDRFQRAMVATARRELARVIGDRAWTRWAAQLAPVVAIEAVLAWLDAGRPGPDQAADRIRQVLGGVITAAQQP
jgi:hypothetical protein